MKVSYSSSRRPRPTDAQINSILHEVSADSLRQFVERISFPRHYLAEHRANLRARDLLLAQLQKFGYQPEFQGSYDNIVAVTGEGPYLLLGAHYDSVPGTPCADDNGSAVAACLECARLVQEHEIGGVMIVLFNREEDGLLGSQEFVAAIPQSGYEIAEAHIFEMVGYCTTAPGSQRMPPGLPGIVAPDVGDFLALLANRHSNGIAEQLLKLAASYLPQFPVIALKLYLGIEKYLGHLNRSDHAPFWQAGIPAIMWTDTSEFRNQNYHQATDTPETLDYQYLSRVTQLAFARVLAWQGT
jgi:Zn-dependent M28 family amino/carboxypeptidase